MIKLDFDDFFLENKKNLSLVCSFTPSIILSYTHLLCVPWGFRLNDDLNEKEHRKTHVDKWIPSIVTKLKVSDMFLQKIFFRS
jgi:hypothetical protein